MIGSLALAILLGPPGAPPTSTAPPTSAPPNGTTEAPAQPAGETAPTRQAPPIGAPPETILPGSPPPSAGPAPAPTPAPPTSSGFPEASQPVVDHPSAETAPVAESPAPRTRPPRLKPDPIKQSEDNIGQRPPENEDTLDHRLSAHGEWYLPDAYDASLRDKTRDAWNGKYKALELRYDLYGFMNGGVKGELGSSIAGKIDFSNAFAVSAGAYFPNNAFMLGFNLFGNYRIRLAESQRADVSFGLVLPELTTRIIVARDPRTVVLATGLNIIGMRLVIADLVQLTVRGGAPGFWLTVPQLGTATSWNVTTSLGVTF